MTQETVIRNILYAARMKGIRIGALEKYIGVSTGYISRCRNDNNPISLVRVIMAAEMLDIPISRLFEDDFATRAELEEVKSQISDLNKRKEELEGRLGA